MASAPHTVNANLAALVAAGTAPWLDQIRRGLITSGELARLRDECSLRGVTSNPTIFEQAILGSDDYDEALAELAHEDLDAGALYERLAITDVQDAADILRPVFDEHGDGFVSFEVMPTLATDTDATLAQARDYWQRLDRPNVMIKIPGTKEGIPAIEQALYEGININITLLFGVERYAQVAEAYLRALERRAAEGLSLEVHSVASFFVSRIDTEVDKRLAALGRGDLAGTAALANARAAYARCEEIFGGERFAALREAGALVQRPLWASTGVKNPAYPETMYVDGLIAPDTVNTMPMKTLLAVAERGTIVEGTAREDAGPALAALAEAGIDMDDVTDTLLEAGIAAFVTPMEKLLAGIESERQAILTGRPQAIAASLDKGLSEAVAKRVATATQERVAHRVWAKDESLWGGPGVPEIGDRLGWLTISDAMAERADELVEFARSCAADGLRDAVLLGMGGSSLAPEVLWRTFGAEQEWLALHVLDSTDPAAILGVQEQIDLDRTLFVVSTKSGGTIETLSLFEHFHSLVPDGSRFIAITDPGSSLLDLAREHNFRAAFENDPNIGGRYSALSLFGLVPAALIGAPVHALLDRAEQAEQASSHFDSSASNPGLWLGLALGELARQGRDKLTFVVGEPAPSFGLWAEQLVAESTGKKGRGILPVADEPLLEPDAYGSDRVFVHLRDEERVDEDTDKRVEALAAAGHPTLTLSVNGSEDLGRMFFTAEFATAVAGWVLEINPFDQPNVQEAKDATKRVLASGSLPEVTYAEDDALRALLTGGAAGSYIALMGYVAPSLEFDEEVRALRETLARATKLATTFGYGPRFLHSTGQLHKGGAPVGRFLSMIGEEGPDVEIPGAPYTFRTLKTAQALGDLETLRSHGLPAEIVHLEGDAAQALRALHNRIKEML
ncbi:MAG TPA: bifunctional transaldolase/phosoglucose isomerase [Solirubrobacteraceae bacterium]|jgi:transaldolase/glucose-6-phosphate isomerase|nr:bifunctional transaldolase/phosoglucose isomerase [Solirubrobacteraceae bacterium]